MQKSWGTSDGKKKDGVDGFAGICVRPVGLRTTGLLDYCNETCDEAFAAMSIYRILEFLEAQQLVHKLKLSNRYVACVHITCNHEHEDRLCVLYFFLIYIHSLLHKLESGKDKLDRKDVLVVDEAGMLDTQLMLRITRAVSKAGAKMVLVGDRPAPLQAMLTQGDIERSAPCVDNKTK